MVKNEDGSYSVKSKVFALRKIEESLRTNNRSIKAQLVREGLLPAKRTASNKDSEQKREASIMDSLRSLLRVTKSTCQNFALKLQRWKRG